MNDYNADITSLGAKLDQLELTDGERHVLDTVLAQEDETAGFGREKYGMKIGRLFDAISARSPYAPRGKDSVLDATQGAGVLDATQGAGVLDATQGAG